jgi:hypothetical protein
MPSPKATLPASTGATSRPCSEPIIPRPGEGAVWLETGEERGDEGIHRDFEITAAKRAATRRQRHCGYPRDAAQ